VTTTPDASAPAERLYRLLVDDDEDHGRGDLAGDPEAVPGNGVKLVTAMTLQKIGDRIVDPKTVLPWLFAALGAPAALTGLLVPVRESGSLLPQAALVPVVRRVAHRRWVWVAGAAGQATAVVAMAMLAAFAGGAAAGWGILAALAVFALSRSLSSIASKDVLGRTIPKGQRGQISGAATVTSGLVAITVGIVIRLLGEGAGPRTFALLLGAGAAMWVVGLVVFATIREPAGEADADAGAQAIVRALSLLRDDRPFRRFVVARTLLLVSALAPPFVVTLATEDADLELAGLGPFVVAQGLASLLGGRVWGRLADRSSRRVMVVASGAASLVVLAFLAATRVRALRDLVLLYPLVYLVLALIHTGARIGRKTYVVDLAEGNRRTDHVAVANTAMGVLLLVTGALSAGLAGFGVEVALVFLAALGLAAVPVARSLPEVSRRVSRAGAAMRHPMSVPTRSDRGLRP
jgi:hypothetical protein